MMPLLLLALLSDLSNEIATISHLVPSTYLLNGINDAMLNNAGITETYVELLVLIAFNMIVYFLAIRTIKNKRQMGN
jgi:ABC-2 type transport system permease protein